MEVLTLNDLWSKILGIFPSKTQVITALAGKQDVLIPGAGISIDENNVIVCDALGDINEVLDEINGEII